MISREERNNAIYNLRVKDKLQITVIADRFGMCAQNVHKILLAKGAPIGMCRQTADKQWDDDTELLIKLYTTTELPLREIGEKLKHKRSVTAISRRVARLIETKIITRRKVVVPIAPTPIAMRRISERAMLPPRKPDVELPAKTMVAFKPAAGSYSLRQLGACSCRWPYEDGRFCGAPIATGSRPPYCHPHASLSRRPPQSSSAATPPSRQSQASARRSQPDAS